MGIDATAVCTALPKGWLSRMSGQKALQAIPKLATNWAAAQGLGPLFQTALLPDGTLQVELVPIAEPLHFTATADRLAVSFRSSGMGPGYHRAVVALLDHLADKMKFAWGWVATDGTPLDETGYGQTRDAAALDAAMLEFLRSLAHIADTSMSNHETSELALCVPFGLGQENGKIACPMGYQPPEWAGAVAHMDDAALLSAAKAFFPWWEAGLGGPTLESLLRAMLWQNAEWRRPLMASDQRVQSQIGHVQERLQAVGHAVPADLQTALQEYESCLATDTPPPPEGIGYRKRPIQQQIFKSWSLKRPGIAWQIDRGDGVAWEHPAFWLGASALSKARVEPGPEPTDWPDMFKGPTKNLPSGVQYRLSPREAVANGGGRQMAVLVSRRAIETQVLILTLSSELNWPYEAFETWVASVTCPDLPARPPTPVPLH